MDCEMIDQDEWFHGIGCEHILCTDCGELLQFRDDTCTECGREEAG